jgi:hypothetical protein
MYAIIVQSIAEELEKVGEALKEELRRDGHYATGKTEKSIRVEAAPNSVSLKSNAAPKYLTEGSEKVKSGSGGILYNAILAWVKAKGVTPTGMKNESFAWAIYNKRVKHGYTVPNAFNTGDTVGRAVDLEAIMKRIETVIGADVAKYVESNINF